MEIEELAGISEAPAPVVTRVVFSEADLRARAYLKKLCVAAELEIRRGCGWEYVCALGWIEPGVSRSGDGFAHRCDSERRGV